MIVSMSSECMVYASSGEEARKLAEFDDWDEMDIRFPHEITKENQIPEHLHDQIPYGNEEYVGDRTALQVFHREGEEEEPYVDTETMDMFSKE